MLDPAHRDVVGCVHLFPSHDQNFDVEVQPWVREDVGALDGPRADAVVGWIRDDWTWQRPQCCAR